MFERNIRAHRIQTVVHQELKYVQNYLQQIVRLIRLWIAISMCRPPIIKTTLSSHTDPDISTGRILQVNTRVDQQ